MTYSIKPILTLVPDITDPDLQCQLGEMYFFGKGIAQDMHKGVQWYKKAAEQGHIAAQCSLGFCYQKGAGVTRDVQQALHWYSTAANQEDAFAAYYLGLIYEKGEGVQADLALACSWFGQAAFWGHREAALKKAEIESRAQNVIPFPHHARLTKLRR